MGRTRMTSVNPSSFAGAGARRVDCNFVVLRRIGAADSRDTKTFKTNPIVPSLPVAAARCAFASPGAQRAPNQKLRDPNFLQAERANRQGRQERRDRKR